MRRNERLFDRPRADPTNQVQHTTGLVVRTRRAPTTERLLSNDRTRRLVVDVEVPGSMCQALGQIDDDIAILSKNRSGQRVRRAGVALRQRLVELVVAVDMDGENRPEDLLAHQLEVRLLRQHDRGFDEESLTSAVAAATDDLGVLRPLGVGDVLGDAVVGVAVDHRTHEVREVGGVAHADLGDLGDQFLLHARPE